MPNTNASVIVPKKKVEVELYRKDGETFFKFKVDPALTKYYADHSEGTRDSESWPGLTFYVCSTIQQETSYRNLLSEYSLYDDYGYGLTRNNYFNVAWLRTVGGEGTIKLAGTPAYAALSMGVRNLTTFLKAYLSETFREFKLKGTVTIEV